MMCPGGFTGWGMAWMSLSSILLLALVIGAIVLFARYLGKPTGAMAGPHSGAEQILAERYARGDIDEKEYRQRLGALRDQQS